ncbi:hypothetical protein [Pyrococcus kukulkanii]|uniref:Uncharacterized protein n=1 Tax=Pyrococcus kukulkanii TaxID=1609559 RepID=A0ABV4T999_9EURY
MIVKDRLEKITKEIRENSNVDVAKILEKGDEFWKAFIRIIDKTKE